MNEIKKIRRYIERTQMDETGRYYLAFGEAMELTRQACGTDFPISVIELAFNYGKAKGFRLAKAKAVKG